MLEFKDSFFEAEERDGFMVPKKMKHVWAAELEFLMEIDLICKKYDLQYYLDYASLLGAIRHKGFIPWDDDMDICMKRADYDMLFRVLPDELPDSYGIYSHHYNPHRRDVKGCITNSKSICMDEEFLHKFHGCPYIIGLDIFPMDPVPDEKKDFDLIRSLYHIIYDAAFNYEKLKEAGELETALANVENFTGAGLDRGGDVCGELWDLADKFSQMYSNEECDRITWYPDMVAGSMYDRTTCRKKEWFEDVLMLPFENIMLPVPAGYEPILVNRFGHDYMTPIKGAAVHDYPFYKKQDIWLSRHPEVFPEFPFELTLE